MEIKNFMEDIAGIVCKTILPIRAGCYMGKGSTIAICTLSSMDLLMEISKNEYFMERIHLVSKLLSENRGIDSIIKYVISNNHLKHIILCGLDTKGHLPGNAILSLVRNGMDKNGIIFNSKSHRPLINSSKSDVNKFRRIVKIHDRIGEKNIHVLKLLLDTLQ